MRRVLAYYFKMFPEQEQSALNNSGYALLSQEGIIKNGRIFVNNSGRSDIFQLQMYYYAVLQATGLDSLQGLRVLDVSYGQANCLNFLQKHFAPRSLVNYETIMRQFQAAGGSSPHVQGMRNLSFNLQRESRFDLILCIETWNRLDDQNSFLNQARELLSQSDEQDQAPYNSIDAHLPNKQRLVIADLFRLTEQDSIRARLEKFFEIETTIDISINVQKSLIKQADRRKRYLAGKSHLQIAKEALLQLAGLFKTSSSAEQADEHLARTPLFLSGEEKLAKLKGTGADAHVYLIYVLKHKELLQQSCIQSDDSISLNYN